MAEYKVPQDVEAEDKLLGPFSFKQFVFLLIAVISLGVAYLMFTIFAPLVVIPIPIAVFFVALALPLRKDQPMEVYMAAVISFWRKPKVRIWHADGIETLVEVTAPNIEDQTDKYSKGYSDQEVHKRLSYLANIVDSHGWSVRGVDNPNNSVVDDIHIESEEIDDLLGDDNSRAKQIDALVHQADAKRRQEMEDIMRGKTAAEPPQVENDVNPQIPHLQIDDPYASITMNPYPNMMKQSVISPNYRNRPPISTGQQTEGNQANQEPTKEPATSTKDASSVTIDIEDLASNKEYSIETIQKEAERRLKAKEDEAQKLAEEVVISLR